MTVKGNMIYVTAKDMKAAHLGDAEKSELETALELAGYELVVENSDDR
jgi:hypothetical protein